ncbi:MAG: ATP synthase F1 subunit delta [Candidatus Sumerlaeaceae bacterium]
MILFDPTVAERYAHALFNVAKRQGAHQQMLPDAEELLKLFAAKSSLRSFLEGPQIPTENKEQLLEKIFKGKIHDMAYHILTLLLKKGRIEYVEPILEQFRTLVERDQGIYEARVSTAHSLDEATKKQLQTALETYTKHRLKISFCVEPALIGGVRVTYGDTLIDDSVRGKLGKLRQTLEVAASER